MTHDAKKTEARRRVRRADRAERCNTLRYCTLRLLETDDNEILIEEFIRMSAVVPVRRMLEFAARKKKEIVGDA